jgi:hypothetical protein
MNRLETMNARRQEILEELAKLHEIRRGSITEQYVETTRKDGTPKRRGPYPLYTFKDKGRTISRRLTDPDLVPLYRTQIEGFRRFQDLTAELLAIGEEISDLVVTEQDVKRTSKPKSGSKKTPR